MYSSSLILGALCAMVALATPNYPQFDAKSASKGSIDTMAKYMDMLASKVRQSRFMSDAPLCDLSQAVLPVASPSPLPAPASGLTLKHVAVGRGTQNYTCDTTNATAAPVSIGAVATLFNASCIAAAYPALLEALPAVALEFNMTLDSKPAFPGSGPVFAAPWARGRMAPSDLAVSGHHIFTNATTPFFNLDAQPNRQLGLAPCAKNSSVPAPPGAPAGQLGEPAVAWLRLLTRSGATGSLLEVYRVGTAGGSPPATCAGQPATFEVQYAAQYWFFQGDSAQ